MNYEKLLEKIKTYEKKYKIKTIGHSVLERNIFAVERVINESFFTAIFVASVHAREYISTDLLCKFLDGNLFDEIEDFNISLILMANPDGVELSNFGVESVYDENLRNNLLIANNNSFNFLLWKANAKGVDINNNFDADFGKFVSSSKPASQGYAGKFKESEPETKAIVEYIKSNNAFLVLAYHSKGEEIYYNYFQNAEKLKRDRIIAEKFADSTGYKIVNVENSSSGGLKDWCVKKLKIPSLTIEIGSDELNHPIKEDKIDEIFVKNKTIAKDLKYAYNVFRKFMVKGDG